MTTRETLALLGERLRNGTIPAKDRSFAESLLSAAYARGWSAKQEHWARKLVEARTSTALAATVLGIFTMFAQAKAKGLQWPKVRLSTDETPVILGQAGERSRYVGQVMITDGNGMSGKYFGRIDAEGTFHVGKDLTASVGTLIAELAANPAQVARMYGRRTGSCCFCGRHLETAESVSSGYGPVCAEKFGLPWERAADYSGNSVSVGELPGGI